MASLAFSTISTNSGVINNVNMRNVSVRTVYRSHVAGLVAQNNSGAKIKNCLIEFLALSSSFVSPICTNNQGYIDLETVKCTSLSYVGNIYNQGV